MVMRKHNMAPKPVKVGANAGIRKARTKSQKGLSDADMLSHLSKRTVAEKQLDGHDKPNMAIIEEEDSDAWIFFWLAI